MGEVLFNPVVSSPILGPSFRSPDMGPQLRAPHYSRKAPRTLDLQGHTIKLTKADWNCHCCCEIALFLHQTTAHPMLPPDDCTTSTAHFASFPLPTLFVVSQSYRDQADMASRFGFAQQSRTSLFRAVSCRFWESGSTVSIRHRTGSAKAADRRSKSGYLQSRIIN